MSLCGLDLDKNMQLLKRKGLQLDRAWGHVDAEELTKRKQFAKYEEETADRASCSSEKHGNSPYSSSVC